MRSVPKRSNEPLALKPLWGTEQAENANHTYDHIREHGVRGIIFSFRRVSRVDYSAGAT